MRECYRMPKHLNVQFIKFVFVHTSQVKRQTKIDVDVFLCFLSSSVFLRGIVCVQWTKNNSNYY